MDAPLSHEPEPSNSAQGQAIDQEGWHRKTEQLVGRELVWIRGDWASAYVAIDKFGAVFRPEHDYSNTALVHSLLELGENPSNALFNIIDGGNPDSIRLVLQYPRLRIDKYDYRSLISLIETEDTEIVKLFVSKVGKIKATVLNDSLRKSISLGDQETSAYLRTLGAESDHVRVDKALDARRQSAFDARMSIDLRLCGLPDLVQLSLLLVDAIRLNRIDALRTIISEARAAIGDDAGELFSPIWKTSLIYACKFRSAEMVRLLLDLGLDPSFLGNKCLRLARKYKRADIVELLLVDERVRGYGW